MLKIGFVVITRKTCSMPKPGWMKDNERKKNLPDPDTCLTCIYFGQVVGFTKYKNKERVEVRECDIHPKCLNTKYSIRCEDWIKEI